MDDANKTFGQLLKTEREKRRDSLAHVSHELKIRETILSDFENENYDEFPPEGYAQGMISSYARYLGLDPAEVLDLYRDGLENHEVSVAHAVALPKGRAKKSNKSTRPAKGSSRDSSRTKKAPRRAYDEGNPPITSGRSAVATGRERHEMPWQRMLLIAVIVLVVGLGIWALASFLLRGDKTTPPPITNEETTTTPVEEVEETATIQGGANATESAHLPFEVEISIPVGETSWVEVDVDGGKGYVGSLVGPASEKYTVSDKTDILIGRPSVVTVKRDGVAVEIPAEDGMGKVTLSVSDVVTQ